jgi:hypothetical protein
LAIVVPIGLLASRVPERRNEQRVRPWTEIFAVVFIFNALTYLNIVKNLEDWTAARKIAVNGAEGVFRSVAELLQAPLFGSVSLSAWSWFTLMWMAFTFCTILVLARHRRRSVALIPSTWLGKGQLLFLMFLWLMVIANFAKALVAFSDGRIATEGTIMFNALVCTVLILVCARQPDEAPAFKEADFGRFTRKAAVLAAVLLVATATLYTTGIRSLYEDRPTGWGGHNLRFGPDADWRVKPLLRTKPHA